jgi:hypothetical protein
MMLEGRVVSKEPGLRAVFGGVEQPYVRCVVSRLDAPDRHAEARVIGLEDLPVGIGGIVRLEVTRAITDRKAGIVRFDCTLISSSPGEP